MELDPNQLKVKPSTKIKSKQIKVNCDQLRSIRNNKHRWLKGVASNCKKLKRTVNNWNLLKLKTVTTR